jgi:hypothetical protein
MRNLHKKDISVCGSSFRKSSFRGSKPKDNLIRGRNPDGKLPFPLMSKGGRFIRFMDRELDSWREKEHR